MSFTTLKPATRTEAEARSAGHTPTPWFQCLHNGGGETGADVDIEIRPGGWFLRLSPGYPFSQMANPAESEKEFEANVAFAMLVVNSHDAMKSALGELLEQIECLGGIEFSKDLEPYKAEAIWDDTIRHAQDALTLARGAKP